MQLPELITKKGLSVACSVKSDAPGNHVLFSTGECAQEIYTFTVNTIRNIIILLT